MPRWTEEEVAILRTFFPKEKTAQVAKRLGRTWASVTYKVRTLGLTEKYTSGTRWSVKECKNLCLGWNEYSARGLRKLLPGRTWAAIVCRAKKLGLGPRLQGYITVPKAAQILGVDEAVVVKIIEEENVTYIFRRQVCSPPKGSKKARGWIYMEEEEIRAAGARYFERKAGLENAAEAARRLNVTPMKMLRAYRRRSGALPSSGPHQEPPEFWNKILAEYQERIKCSMKEVAMGNLRRANVVRRERAGLGSKGIAPSVTPTASSSKNRSKAASSVSSTSSPKTPDTTSTAASKRTASAPT